MSESKGNSGTSSEGRTIEAPDSKPDPRAPLERDAQGRMNVASRLFPNAPPIWDRPPQDKRAVKFAFLVRRQLKAGRLDDYEIVEWLQLYDKYAPTNEGRGTGKLKLNFAAHGDKVALQMEQGDDTGTEQKSDGVYIFEALTNFYESSVKEIRQAYKEADERVRAAEKKSQDFFELALKEIKDAMKIGGVDAMKSANLILQTSARDSGNSSAEIIKASVGVITDSIKINQMGIDQIKKYTELLQAGQATESDIDMFLRAAGPFAPILMEKLNLAPETRKTVNKFLEMHAEGSKEERKK